MKKASLMLVAVMVIAAVYYGYQRSLPQAPAARAGGPVQVVTVPVRYQRMSDEIEALGTTEAFESVTVTASVSEKIEQVHFHDNQQVKAGQLLVTLNHQEEQAELDAAKVNLKEQLREYRRIGELVRKKTMAASELDRLQSAVDVAKANVAKAQAQLDDRFIRAPFDGVLGFRQVSPGSLVSPGTAITTLDDVNPMKLDFTVPERFLPVLAKGKAIFASTDAVAGKHFQGNVASIDTRIDPVSRSAMVRAELDNRNGLLRPGMLLKVRLVKEARDTLTVPSAAIFQIKDQHYVFVVTDGRVQRRAIEIGLRLPGVVEVAKGLGKGEQVIIRGLLKVRDGAKVDVKAEDYPGAEA